MPANSTHPDYDANATSWLRALDVIAGEDAVKAAGEKYLPKLDSQSADEYRAYKTRASFFNATARTADGRRCGFDLVMLQLGGGNRSTGANSIILRRNCGYLFSVAVRLSSSPNADSHDDRSTVPHSVK